VAAVGGLTAGLNAVRDSAAAVSQSAAGLCDRLDLQATREESLLRTLEPLAGLPAALSTLEHLPETSRVHTEVLRTLRRHADAEAARGDQIADILDRITRADADHRRALDALTGRVEAMGRHDRELCDRLSAVGTALETAARRSAAGAAAMEQLGENLAKRDRDLERLVERQNLRWATLVVTAGVLSVAALTAVMVFGYLMLTRGHG
jgi:hypothetical protein